MAPTPPSSTATSSTSTGDSRRRRSDPTPIADFIVPANGSKKQKDALQFITYPEEIRLVSPVERSFLISIVDDLDDDDRWTLPLEVCDDADPTTTG